MSKELEPETITGKDVELACEMYSRVEKYVNSFKGMGGGYSGMSCGNIIDFYQSKYFNYFLPVRNEKQTINKIAKCKIFSDKKACEKFINWGGNLIYRAGVATSSSHSKTLSLYIVYYHPIKVGKLRGRIQFLLNELNIKKESIYKVYGLDYLF